MSLFLQVWTLAKSHNYLALAVVVIGWLARMLKKDSRFPLTVPERWRPFAVVLLGLAYGALVAVSGGEPWPEALRDGFEAALFAMGLYAVVIKAALGGNPPRFLALLALVSEQKDLEKEAVPPTPKN